MLSSKTSTGNGYFDSHCHLNDLSNPVKLVSEANAMEIRRFLIPSTQFTQWEEVKETAQKLPGCSIALGTHPWFVRDPDSELNDLQSALSSAVVSAIGEIGLDFYRSKHPRPERPIQLRSFKNQLSLAVQYDLPVIIHSVKAHNDTLRLLRECGSESGVIHAFNGSLELAQAYIKLGLKLGIGPMLLRSKKLQQVVLDISLEHLVLETDAPYMVSPQCELNPLVALVDVATQVAEIKKEDVKVVKQATYDNASFLFKS
jgi:TatD DNase family protein